MDGYVLEQLRLEVATGMARASGLPVAEEAAFLRTPEGDALFASVVAAGARERACERARAATRGSAAGDLSSGDPPPANGRRIAPGLLRPAAARSSVSRSRKSPRRRLHATGAGTEGSSFDAFSRYRVGPQGQGRTVRPRGEP